MKQGEMLNILVEILSDMPDLLKNKSGWMSLDINDEAPHVERIWRKIGDRRVNLHKIYPSNKQPLFHPHPWPSAMIILKGSYETAIGYGKNKPPIVYTAVLTEGAMYEMVDKDTWHYVLPLNEPCYTIMITGLPWDISSHSNRKFLPLTEEVFDEVYSFFQQYFIKP